MTTFNPTESAPDLRPEATTAAEIGPNVGEVIAERMEHADERRAEDGRMDEPGAGRLSCNVGRTEQKFRIGMGSALLAAAAFAPVSRGWRIAFAVLGAAEVITGATRYCPVSHLFGVNTCRGTER